MVRSADAHALWVELYDELTSPKAGLLGSLLARGAAHVTRLSAIYALLGGSSGRIEVENLYSAAALWDVVSRSTAIVFRDRTGNPDSDRIRESARIGEDYSLTRLRDEIFRGRITSSRLEDACDLLVQTGEFILVSQRNTGGRPAKILRRLYEDSENRKRSRQSDSRPTNKLFSGFSCFSDDVSQ
jgi:hypothetical protein